MTSFKMALSTDGVGVKRTVSTQFPEGTSSRRDQLCNDYANQYCFYMMK